MAFPRNEEQTIELFRFLEPWIRWRIVHLQTRFPDAIIEHQNGARLIVEFEHSSVNYKTHDHPNEGCDLIVCFRDNWPEAPLPIWALEEVMMSERENVPRLKQRLQKAHKDVWNLYCKVESLEQELIDLKRESDRIKTARDWYKDRQIPWQGRNKLGDIIWYSENWENRARMQQFLAYALSWEPVSAYLDMIFCGGGNAPPGTESRKAIMGRANDLRWDYWDGWEADRS